MACVDFLKEGEIIYVSYAAVPGFRHLAGGERTGTFHGNLQEKVEDLKQHSFVFRSSLLMDYGF